MNTHTLGVFLTENGLRIKKGRDLLRLNYLIVLRIYDKRVRSC